jgi:hypothetical protein
MFQRIFLGQLIILLGFLAIDINKNQAKTLTLDDTYISYNENLFRQDNEIRKVVFIASNQQASCDNIHRPLNPEPIFGNY